jgi:cation diffusion facilitator family transporter
MMEVPQSQAMANARQEKTRADVLYVVWLTLFLNLINVVAKFAVGTITGNLTVLADGVHATIDAVNNMVGLITLKLAYRPPDTDHPYGHRKYEAVASLAIGGLMALTSWEILKSNIQHLWAMYKGVAEPAATFSGIGLGLVFIGFLSNIFITTYEYRRGQALKSQFLIADALHTRSDIFVTVLSMSSLIMAPRWPVLDMALSLVIVGLILRSGWRVIRENMHLLTDAVQMDPEPIRRVVQGVRGVKNCHAIRSHGMPDDVHLDLHIVIPADVTAGEAHSIESEVRTTLMAAFPDVAEVAIHHQVQEPKTERPIRR